MAVPILISERGTNITLSGSLTVWFDVSLRICQRASRNALMLKTLVSQYDL